MDNFKIIKKELEDLKHELNKIQDILENSPTPHESLAKKAVEEAKIPQEEKNNR